MVQYDRRYFYWLLGELARRHQEPPGVVTETLTSCELCVLSENGEDGIIAEIMRRIGPGGRYFIEFGAGAGTVGNCVFLADVLHWSGLFLESAPDRARDLGKKYRGNSRVATRQALVTAMNVNGLLREANVPNEPDLLSIDVDGNDFWIWAAIRDIRPRVVIVEYNADLDPRSHRVQPYVEDWQWDGTNFFGASLGALRRLGAALGYQLVHTELAGVNAFFVRDDLADCFADIDLVAVPERSPNYYNLGHGHPADPHSRPYLDLDRDHVDFMRFSHVQAPVESV